MRMPNKIWGRCFLAMLGICLVGLAGLTVAVDPYFHYHKPLEGIEYRLYHERYQNDGVVKNFEYDAIITGTSMTQNFKTSEFDALFDVHSVKVPFSGGGYQEINNNLARALEANPDIKLILRGLDYGMLALPADWSTYSKDQYPDYLYDDKLYNDIKYVLNKTVLFDGTIGALEYTKAGGMTTSFDDYNNWMNGQVFGKEALLALYEGEQPEPNDTVSFTKTDYEMLQSNMICNVTSLVEQYPDVEFYYFFTPYSIYYFNNLYREGKLERQLIIEKCAIEQLVQYENVHLFSFFTEFDMIMDPNNYKDVTHYHEDINSEILEWMATGYGELTLDNYEVYCEKERAFYMNYDYDALFPK